MKIPDLSYEKSLIPLNCRYLLGIDEVGRGPWAGPVSIGAFILDLENFDQDFFQKNIRDSKLLTPTRRQSAFNEIKNRNYRYFVISAYSSDIDSFGIQKTILNCFEKAIKHFQGSFDYILIDGNLKLPGNFPYKSVIKADSNCFSVAAASICAKVTRDSIMEEYSHSYPDYGFDQHKGYGTSTHLSALKKFGPCPIHRQSFKPIKYYSLSR